MVASGCPTWNYDSFVGFKVVLAQRVGELVTDIQAGRCPVALHIKDMRSIHERVFEELTYTGFEYYAGHYRGERDCLIDYEVGIPGEPLVGVNSANVGEVMRDLGEKMEQILPAVEAQLARSDPPNRALLAVRFAALCFVNFLTIHPFADGNGHSSRALLWIILRHFGYVVPTWTIEPRPSVPTYGDMIALHRRGNQSPLVLFLLQNIAIPNPIQ